MNPNDMRFALTLLAVSCFAQETAPQPPAMELSPVEKKFQEQMSGVTMTGYFTVGDSAETKPDLYNIDKVVKIKDGVWNFSARIKYGTKEFKAVVAVPIQWAGDTPVITLQNYLIQGQGVYSARILIFNGMYAGTWGAQDHGGKMFGKIVKQEAPAAEAK